MLFVYTFLRFHWNRKWARATAAPHNIKSNVCYTHNWSQQIRLAGANWPISECLYVRPIPTWIRIIVVDPHTMAETDALIQKLSAVNYLNCSFSNKWMVLLFQLCLGYCLFKLNSIRTMRAKMFMRHWIGFRGNIITSVEANRCPGVTQRIFEKTFIISYRKTFVDSQTFFVMIHSTENTTYSTIDSFFGWS